MIPAILHTGFFLLFTYLLINTLYLFILAIAGHALKKKSAPWNSHKKRFAVLITSFKEDDVIVKTAEQASHHNYPTEYFDVYLAADQLQQATIEKLRQINIKLYEVHFETGSKAKSLNYLLNKIDADKYDIALILDADNVMAPGFLEKTNTAFQNNYHATQGHRTAKNKNNAVAILDAISEEINNHLFRKAQRVLGFSASTIGSGMAFDFKKLKEVYNKPGILDNPACDREVDFEMMKAGIIVEYMDDACILDEKVSQKKVFQNQRRRWLESQVVHLKLFFSKREKVEHKTKDYWNKLFINLIPPRIIFLALLLITTGIAVSEYIFNYSITGISPITWITLLIVYIFSLAISVPSDYFNWKTFRAFLHLPVLLFLFIKAAFSMRSARKDFVHTPKTFTDD